MLMGVITCIVDGRYIKLHVDGCYYLYCRWQIHKASCWWV